MRAFIGLALGSAMTISPVAAQNGATIAGRVVHKVSKAGIVGAEVRIAPGSRRLVSDPAGHFQFDQVAPGNVTLLVRRLGFAPESVYFPVEANDELDVIIELEQVPQPLDTVSVSEPEDRLVRGKLSGYFDRKRFGIGKFIDAEMIAKEQRGYLGDIIIAQTPGSRLVRSRIGISAWIATTRDTGARPDGGVRLDPTDLRRGADPLACYPDVYLDGSIVYRFNSGTALFDINSIAAAEVAAIEVYVGTARIPLQYTSSSSACGVLLIWTK